MIPMAIIQFAVFLFKVNYDIVISFSRFSLYITYWSLTVEYQEKYLQVL